MANSFSTEELNENGLSLLSYTDIQTALEDGLNSIYAQDGETINFGSETQDGQVVNIFSQAGSDNRELARQVYNSFNPDNCEGSVQDQRYAINYITRKPGTFTIQNIDIVIDKTVTLQGLDSQYNNVSASFYTVSDDGGQLWFLIDTVTLSPGLYSLPFRSQNYGIFIPAIGTITNQVTTVLGVVSVNNSVAPTTLGEEQESSAEFRIRRTRSTAKNGQNNLDALNAALLDLTGISDCYVHNNPGSTTDATGTPAQTVWVIVEGGANSDIGAMIYQYSCGLPTRGNVSVTMRSLSGELFPTYFDRAVPIPLYLKFDYETPSTVGDDFLTALKENIAENLTYILNETAETSKPTCTAKNAILSLGGSGFPLNVQISTGGSGSATTTSVTISDISFNVTPFLSEMGNISTGSYVFTYSDDSWTYNSEEVNINDYGITYTGTPADDDTITIAYTEGSWTDLIQSASLQNKFVVDATRIYITNTSI